MIDFLDEIFFQLLAEGKQFHSKPGSLVVRLCAKKLRKILRLFLSAYVIALFQSGYHINRLGMVVGIYLVFLFCWQQYFF